MQDFRHQKGAKIHQREGFIAPQRVEREKLIQAALRLIDQQIDAYIRAHARSLDWAKRVRAHSKQLITGQPASGSGLDEETRQLVRGWVQEARQATGLKPPNRATKPKRKKRS